MSSTTTTTAAVPTTDEQAPDLFDSLVAASLAQETQAPETALSNLIDASAISASAGEGASAAVAGYESAYEAMVVAFGYALQAGNTEDQIRKALAADAKASGAQHTGASADAAQTLSSLAALAAKDGDLPEGWVYRGAANARGIGLLEGEQSLTALIRAVRNPADSKILRDAGQGSLYGKAVVKAIIADATSKATAVQGLIEARKAIQDALREAKRPPVTPKDVLRLLKSAKGPLGKSVESADAGLIEAGDVAEARTLIAEMVSVLDTLAKHSALAVAATAGE